MGNLKRLALACLLLVLLLGGAAARDLLAITEFRLMDETDKVQKDIFFYNETMCIDFTVKNMTTDHLCADISAELTDAATHTNWSATPSVVPYKIWETPNKEPFTGWEAREFPRFNNIVNKCYTIAAPNVVPAPGTVVAPRLVYPNIQIGEGQYRLRVVVDNITYCPGGSGVPALPETQEWNNEATTYFTIADAHNPLDAPEIPAPFVLFILVAVLIITRNKGEMKG